MQELQTAHLQVMESYAEGRSPQELADLAQQPMPVVEAWLQVGLQYFVEAGLCAAAQRKTWITTANIPQGLQDTISSAMQFLVPSPYADLDRALRQLDLPAAVPMAVVTILVQRQQKVCLLFSFIQRPMRCAL